MTTIVQTRIATPDDAPALARLNTAFNETSDTPEQIAVRLRDPRRVEMPILAEIDGAAVGFAAVRVVPSVFYTEPYAELTELFVEAAYRRQGVARALLAHAEQLAQEAGATQLYLLTGIDNEDAQQFYGAVGYADYALALHKRLR